MTPDSIGAHAMSGTAAPDPRTEPVMFELNRCQQAVAFGRGNARRLLIVADAADRAAGVIRVRVDDATVEKVARWFARQYVERVGTLIFPDAWIEQCWEQFRPEAGAVLESLVSP